jgi:hypothetical protein
MPRQKQSDPQYSFTGGKITEANKLEFPPNASVDENNFFVENDGVRVRRKGLDYESGFLVYNQDVEDSWARTSFLWRNVGGDSSITFLVQQVGSMLHFYTVADTLSSNKKLFTFNLLDKKVTGQLDEDVADSEVDFDEGRGHLFVVGKYIEPFYIEYDLALDSIIPTTIKIQERDFEGVDDGIPDTAEPDSLADAHEYNLKNRGWRQADIDSFFTDQGSYPSKNYVPWLGYATIIDGTGAAGEFADGSGVRQFSSAKLLSQLFGDSSAPQGRFLRNPFDTTTAGSGETNPVFIETWTYDDTTQTVELTTSTAHGLTHPTNIRITGNFFLFNSDSSLSFTNFVDGSLDGIHPTDSVTTNTIRFTYSIPGFTSNSVWLQQYASLGTVGNNVDISVTNPTGRTVEARPEAVAFFAGRVWYAGVDDGVLGTKIYGSQIVERDDQYGKCYQQADPTNEFVNALTPSDGVVLIVPELGKVRKMVRAGDSLVVFADNGIWRLSGTNQRGFTPNSFVLRKLSSVGTVSKRSVIDVGGLPILAAREGMYSLTQDSQTGFLSAQSLTENTVETDYLSLTDEAKANIKCIYDDSNKRVFILFSRTGTASIYDSGYLLDLKFGAFYPFSMPDDDVHVADGIALDSSDNTDVKVKLLAVAKGTEPGFTYSSFRDMDFVDWASYKAINTSSTTTGIDAAGYLETGYRVNGEARLRRQAPYISVFLERTETGFNADLSPTNPGSCLMEARWDWTDNSNSGNVDNSQQVYRHKRQYIPSNSSDTFNSGYPVVFTRNRIRGKGNSLHLRFSTEPGKDCRLIGWHTTQDILTRE